MPKVSLIIPLYNGLRHLSACLDSVSAQTLEDMEVLLVNDGSTDQSVQVAQQYCQKDKRFHLINQVNSGVSSARNHGMEEAHSEYVAFLDQDDVLHPQAMEFLYKMIETYQTDVASFQIEFVPDNFIVSPYQKLYDIKEEITRASVSEHLMKDFFSNYKGGQIYIWNKLYKLSAIKDIKFPIDVQPAEDTVFTLKTLLTVKNMVSTNVKLLYYRQNDASVSKRGITEQYVRSHAKAAKELESLFKNFTQDRWLQPHLDFYLSRFIFKSLVSQPLRLIKGEKRLDQINKAREYALELYQSGALKPQLLGIRKNMACKLFFNKSDKLAKFLV